MTNLMILICQRVPANSDPLSIIMTF